MLRGGVGGRVELFWGHIVLWFALGKANDEGSHGHLNVEFDHVDHGMELNIYDLVLEEHETDKQSL